MPETKLLKLGYTDDWALSYQSKDWEESERVLSRDTTELKRYFEQQYLKINITKTVLSVFHLNASLVWSRGSHTHQIDKKSQDTMKTITGCLKSTPNNWLPVTSAITPPHLRRENFRTQTQKCHQKFLMRAL